MYCVEVVVLPLFILPSKSVNECKHNERERKKNTQNIFPFSYWSFVERCLFPFCSLFFTLCAFRNVSQQQHHQQQQIFLSVFFLIHLYSFQAIYFLNARLISVIDIQLLFGKTNTSKMQVLGCHIARNGTNGEKSRLSL